MWIYSEHGSSLVAILKGLSNVTETGQMFPSTTMGVADSIMLPLSPRNKPI